MQTTQTCQSAEQRQEQAEFAELHLSKPATGAGHWWRRRMRRGYRGQSLVEFAVSLPFLIFLVLALVELGFLIRGHLTVTNAVREGVRTATQAGDYLPINSGPYLDRNVTNPAIPNWGNDYSSNDKRVPIGSDGDSMLVSNVSSALQEKLQDAYLLMTYRADSSDNTKYGLVSKAGERWGVVYIPILDQEKHAKSWPTDNPYQRVFQQITNTLVMTVTDYSSTPTKTVVMPYIRQGWIAGVMDGGVFTFTVSLPFTLPRNVFPGPSTYLITYQSDAYTTVSDKVVAPPDDPDRQWSNLVQVRRSTSPCVGPDPIDVAGKYSGLAPGGQLPKTPKKQFCGTNDPNLHVTPTTPGFEYEFNPNTGFANPDPRPGKSSQTVADAWAASFKADPWYPTWRYPGGFPCDISKPSATPGDDKYFNKPSISPDWLGVRLDYRHYWMTSWFGIPSLNLTDKAVKILEPVTRPSYDWKCKP